ncbi:MAG: FtsX-like permease family protein [Vicinamibacterales bacterium]
MPPRVAQRLLVLLCRGEVGRDVAADLAEEFADVARRHGIRAARQWYRRQVVRSIRDRTFAAAARVVGVSLRAGVRGPAVAVRLARAGRDIGPAIRSLRRAPWYSATVIAVVALALALATTVFAVVDGVLFKPLPYADADELVAVELGFFRDNVYSGRVLPEDIDVWQAALPDVPMSSVRVLETTGFERVNEPDLGAAYVRPNLFEVLGVQPLLGGFSQEDLELLEAVRPPVRPALVTYEFWQSRLGGEVAVIGTEIEPENPSYTPIRVAGVLPPGFTIPAKHDAQFVMAGGGHARAIRDTTVLARLPSGVSPEVFRERLESVLARAAEVKDERGGNKPDRALVRPLDDALEGRLGPVFRGLFAAAGLLALIACLNVSGLMTARCFDRARDIGLRRAIGARATDVIRLLLVEHGLLFAAGAGLGLAASGPLLRFMVGILPTDLHLLKSPEIDARVIVFVTLAMIASLFLASVWPVRRALRSGLQQVITAGGGGAVTPRTAGFASRSITMGQVAGAVVLVVAGGLLVGSLLRVHANEMGYDADRVVIAELGVAIWLDDEALSGNWDAIRVRTRERLASFLEDLRALPDVEAAGAADVDVLVGSLTYSSRFDPVGRDASAEHGLRPESLMVGASGGLNIPVTPGFFEAARVKVIAGRLPTDEELRIGAPVVAVSRSFARRNFEGQRAVGQFVVHKPARPNLPPFEIVGVVEDQRIARWDAPAMSTVFTPYARFGGAIDPVAFVRGVRGGRPLADAVLRFADRERPTLRPVRVQTAAAMLGDSIPVRRLQSWLFGAFAVSGLVLAGVGLFGLVAMTMARRTREVGIRMALGATRDRLVAGLVREQLTPVLLGLVAGVVLAAVLVRFLESYLYELSVYDARVWGAAMTMVVATAVMGALIPSWRASQVDPIRALRVD